jgi:putative MATE family efflux protein
MKRSFYKTLLILALPITIQSLILASVNMADVFMIGKLGGMEVASLGLANQIVFLMTTFIMGVNSGAAVFIAQYHGKKDYSKVKYIVSISTILSILMALFFWYISYITPEYIMGIYTKDPQVIATASKYLRVVAWSYVASAVSFTFSILLRGIGESRLPMLTSFLSLTINIVLNYLLIFGNYGFPQLGVEGAALATSIARGVECVVVVGVIYKRRYPIAIKLKEFFSFDITVLKLFIATAGAVIVNDILWALGQTVYSGIYGRIGTESLAAINIENSFERLAVVGIIGFANAATVMIAHKIGQGKLSEAYSDGKKFYKVSFILALMLAVPLAMLSSKLVGMYNVDENVLRLSKYTLIAFCISFPFKALSMTKMVGVLRGGGDTKFAMGINLIALWMVGIPLAIFAAFYLGLPIYLVYLATLSEEFVRIAIGMKRFVSKKWINKLA